jgi:hypothetical protein
MQKQARQRLTANQLKTLRVMADAKRNDDAWVTLGSTAKKTISSMVKRDLIFKSQGIDGSVKYTITGRGEKALAAAAAKKKKRRDGLCLVCGQAPATRKKNGTSTGYCQRCNSAVHKEYSRSYKRPYRGQLCPRCGVNNVAVARNGTARAYCKQCQSEQVTGYQKRTRDLVEAGLLQHPICAKPGCNQPRLVLKDRVHSYCQQHAREYFMAHHQKRKKEKVARKLEAARR